MTKLENNLNTQSVLSMRGLGYYSERAAGAKLLLIPPNHYGNRKNLKNIIKSIVKPKKY